MERLPHPRQLSHLKLRIDIETHELIPNPYNVREKVKAADKTERKVNDAVLKWLSDVEKLNEEMERNSAISDRTTINIRRLEVYTEMHEKIKTLNNNCVFEPFSTPIPGLEHFSSGNFKCFKPTKVASNQLLEGLQDHNTQIIGLYGRRGTGKTTLVQAVGKKAKYLNIFDAVLFATVSQNPDVRHQFAKSLNLKLSDKNSEAARAIKIYSKLQHVDRILVILDDVRATFDPEDFGIPSRSKILLTTHRRIQECTLMECRIREIPLYPLSKEESWAWTFKKHSGINDKSRSDLLSVAHEVANECKGLLGTIKEVGSSLRDKQIDDWKASLDSLKHSKARWQIFLSSRGEDTRYSFTGSLYRALCQGGFKTFMDDGGGLRNGDRISPSLINAIEASRLSIVVLSENYASSSWCLDELVMILECMKMKNLLVWPIFYKVDPSDIRHQRNSYGKAMAEHENKYFGKENDYDKKIGKWRSALTEVSNLSRKTCKTGQYEYEFIDMIVEDANNIKNHLYIRSMDMD